VRGIPPTAFTIPSGQPEGLTLARLEARIGLVDDVDAALAAHHPVVTVALQERLQGIADFHGLHLIFQAEGRVTPVRLLNTGGVISGVATGCQPIRPNAFLMSTSLNFWITIAVFLFSGSLIAVLVRMERRPRETLEPRLIPTTPLIIIFAFIGLLALVHLANLYGIHTGRR
jgi:hypothetical protein